MKKIFLLLTALLLAAAMSGCDIWMDGEYHSVTPHKDTSVSAGDSGSEISSFMELRQKLEQMVEGGTESGVIYFPGIDKSTLDSYMNSAIEYVMYYTPIGAYAVESIEFETGTKTAKQAIAVTVHYRHGRADILRIRKTDTMDGARIVIASALRNCEAGVTVRVKKYEETDILQYVQDYVNENPDSCMEMPQVAAAAYPDSGDERIIEIVFTYQTSREDLRKMQQTVEPIFSSAELYVRGDGETREKYYQLYSFLMERHNYEYETSITPAYHLLRHGVGDCKAFASVYAAMCRRAGLYCQMVTGTRAGEIWYWNVIQVDDAYYYVDLLACNETGRFTAKTQEQMNGYVWDFDLFRPKTEDENG